LELIVDIGVGKTTFTQGVAKGLGITKTVNSPSFTIMKEYVGRDGLVLKHYDFYRLDDSGIMKNEITDSLSDEKVITVVEWAKDVSGVLPQHRQTIQISYLPDGDERTVVWT
jgi:tRNA threonylcarbamoyladenosine biosynthesis protein TsaE